MWHLFNVENIGIWIQENLNVLNYLFSNLLTNGFYQKLIMRIMENTYIYIWNNDRYNGHIPLSLFFTLNIRPSQRHILYTRFFCCCKFDIPMNNTILPLKDNQSKITNNKQQITYINQWTSIEKNNNISILRIRYSDSVQRHLHTNKNEKQTNKQTN